MFPAEVSLNCITIDEKKYVQAIVRDVTERRKSEELLRSSALELEKQKTALENKNIALREVIGQVEEEKNKLKGDVIDNIEVLLLPLISKLRLKGASRKYCTILEDHLTNVASSFGRKITEKSSRLTSREIEICSMVRSGLTSKEISELLHITDKTVGKHRRNIRKKHYNRI